MHAYSTRAAVAALLLAIAAFALPTHLAHAAPAALYDGMAVQLSGFTPQQDQVIENGLALFDDMASPHLQRPAVLRISAVPGTTDTTYASWQGGQFVGVWITFGTGNVGVPQVIHELQHVAQAENPAWGEAERAYAAAHPYPLDGALGTWIELAAPAPQSEFCPRVLELLMADAPRQHYVAQQPESVRWCLAHLAGG